MGMRQSSLWEFVCDNCGKVEKFAVVPEAQRPPRWHRYTDEFTEYDETGNALHAHTKRTMFCEDCAKKKIRNKSSSPEVAMIASRYLQLDEAAMLGLDPDILIADLKSLAGSVLSQDPESSDPDEESV